MLLLLLLLPLLLLLLLLLLLEYAAAFITAWACSYHDVLRAPAKLICEVVLVVVMITWVIIILKDDLNY